MWIPLLHWQTCNHTYHQTTFKNACMPHRQKRQLQGKGSTEQTLGSWNGKCGFGLVIFSKHYLYCVIDTQESQQILFLFLPCVQLFIIIIQIQYLRNWCHYVMKLHDVVSLNRKSQSSMKRFEIYVINYHEPILILWWTQDDTIVLKPILVQETKITVWNWAGMSEWTCLTCILLSKTTKPLNMLLAWMLNMMMPWHLVIWMHGLLIMNYLLRSIHTWC
jgi:hypothetical protein